MQMEVYQKEVFTMYNCSNKKCNYYNVPNIDFGAFEANPFQRLIFLAQTGLNPKIYVLNYELELIETIDNCYTFELADMFYDHINQWLYLFSKCPEYELKVFDMKNKKILNCEQKININDTMLKYIINPVNRNQLLILEKNEIKCINFYESMSNECNNIQASLQKKETLIQIQDEQDDREGFEFTDFEFEQNGFLIISDNKNGIYLLDLNSQQKIKEQKFEDNYVKRILINRKVIILLMNDNSLKIIDINEENQNFEFNNYQDLVLDCGDIVTIKFDESFRNLIIFNKDNQLYKGQLPLDNQEDSEDKDEDGSQDQNFNIKLQLIDCYHQTPIIHIQYQDKEKQCFSIDQSGYLIIWNLQNFQSVFQQRLSTQIITSALYIKADKLLLIATDKGLLKVFQLNKQNKFEQLQQYFLFDNDYINSIQYNKEWKVISLLTQKNLILIKKDFQEFLNIYGSFDLQQYKIVDFQMYNGKVSLNTIFLTEDRICLNLKFKKLPDSQNKIQKLDTKYYQIGYKRLDEDLNKIVVSNKEQKFYAIGDDLVLKTYEIPSQNYEKFMKERPIAEEPLNEKIVVDTPAILIDKKSKVLNFFTEEGFFVCYDSQKNTISNIEVYGYLNQQVSSYFYDKTKNILIAGNIQGSLYVISNKNPEKISKNTNIDILEYELEPIDENIQLYQNLIELRHLQKIQTQKDEIQTSIKKELQEIQQQYKSLLEDNMQQDDLKKLDYSEFCIDQKQNQDILQQQKQQIEQIQYEARYEQCKNDLIHYKIKQKTYDQMKGHLNTITALQKNLLITNYHIQKECPKEQKVFKKIKMLRKFEVKEKNWLLEQDTTNESFTRYDQFFDGDCDFIINGIPKRPQMILTDFEQREIAIQDYLEEQRKKREKQQKENNNLRAQKKKFQIVNRRVRNKKRLNAAANVKNIDKKNHLLKQQSQGFHSLENVNGESSWLLLYSSVEIITNFTATNQIYFIRNIIQSIKREFNRRFVDLQKQRLKVVDTINETNAKMQNIYIQLEKEGEFFEINENIIQNMENILEVQKNEITIEKYLTREEKRKIEEQKRIDEEKLRAIHQDDSNVRALKMMMNNTLEVKKENIFQKEIEKEDWMDKPKEEMTEEEKIKYNEYLEKQEQLNAETEKLRKILNQEIKKLRTQTQEIIKDFDHKSSILFMQKLEYDYRILEQELIVLKIKKSIFGDRIYKEEIQKTVQDKQDIVLRIDKQAQLQTMIEKKLEFLKQQKQEKDQELAKNDNKSIKQLYQIIQPKDDFKKKKQIDELQLEKIISIKNLNFLHDLDPNLLMNKFYTMEKYLQDPEIYQDVVLDFFSKKLDQNQIEQETKKFFVYLNKKNQLNKLNQEIESVQNIYQNLCDKKQLNEEEFKQLQQFIVEEEQNQIKEKFNVDLMIRLPSLQVEIQTNKVIPLLDDTILIPQQQIENLNNQISEYGNQKVVQLRTTLEEKQKVEADLIEHKILKKEIKEALVESSILTRLKVSKKLQAALNKKNENVMDIEERNTKKQIEKIIQSTQKNLQTIKQKENQMKKEIKFLSQENDNLVLQGGSLQESVNQRKKIFTMVFNNAPQNLFQDENQDQTNNKNYKKDDVAYKKIMQLAQNRKLFDVAKKLAHEIEKMMTELKTLKERTYPNIGSK